MAIDFGAIINGEGSENAEGERLTFGDVILKRQAAIEDIAKSLRELVALYKVTPVMRIQPPDSGAIVSPGRIKLH